MKSKSSKHPSTSPDQNEHAINFVGDVNIGLLPHVGAQDSFLPTSSAEDEQMEPQTRPNPFGSDVDAYWDARYDLFSRFDQGIQVDKEGLFSVKPETLALAIGHTIRGNVVFDAFCGAGGSAIGFARSGKKVLTVDLNEKRLAMAKNNARIYGVEENITFIRGNSLEEIKKHRFDSIYFDPPWGGPGYVKIQHFSFAGFSPDGITLLKLAFERVELVAFTVPHNFDLHEMTSTERDFFLQRGVLRNRHLFSTVYFGHAIGGASTHYK